MSVDEPLVIVETPRPELTVLTLNRPHRRNAISIALAGAVSDTIREANETGTCRAIVLRGAGPVFCAGLDLKEAAGAGGNQANAAAVAWLLDTIAGSESVIIAAAHGAAFAGGGGLMAACDLVVASDSLRIGFPEVRRGLPPALILPVLQRRVAPGRLRELLLLGEPIGAAEAERIGLVDRVAPAADLDRVALELAHQVCRAAPHALRSTKKLLAAAAGPDQARYRQLALEAHELARQSGEAAEGWAAFQAKRPPAWELADEP